MCLVGQPECLLTIGLGRAHAIHLDLVLRRRTQVVQGAEDQHRGMPREMQALAPIDYLHFVCSTLRVLTRTRL